MSAHECQRCGHERRAVVVHPHLTSSSGPVLWCRDCLRAAVKERRRAAISARGSSREDILDSIEQLRRAADAPAYVEPDERQVDLFGGRAR